MKKLCLGLLMALPALLAACGGGGGGGSTSSTPASTTVTGVQTPESVSVVTTN
jgi:hypothetical protein